jgi:hypothetical protein
MLMLYTMALDAPEYFDKESIRPTLTSEVQFRAQIFISGLWQPLKYGHPDTIFLIFRGRHLAFNLQTRLHGTGS